MEVSCEQVPLHNVIVFAASDFSGKMSLGGTDEGGPRIMKGADPFLTQSVFKVVLHKSTPPQIRQLSLYISNSEG